MSGAPRPQRAPPVHVVATGLRCALGLDAASAAAAARAGISLLEEHPFLVNLVGEKIVCAREPTIDARAVGTRRFVQLATSGLSDITATLASFGALPEDLQVLLSLPEARPGFSADDARELQHSLASFPISNVRSVRVSLIGKGHAGSVLAIRAAEDMLLSGRAEIIVVGGVDSYLQSETIAWLDEDRRLAGDGIRSGFHPGEGAAFLAIASDAARRRLNLESIACVGAVECTQEQCDPNGDIGPMGEALTLAVMEATRDLRFTEGEVVTDLYGDINGERGRTEDWGFTVLRASERFRDGTDYVCTVGQCGDLGAATAAAGCVLATEAWRMSRAHGPLALVWGGSWCGLRGALLLVRQSM